MDSEWVNRAGILAEIVSFFLIAPEFLGAKRLKGVEAALEGWLARINPAGDSFLDLVALPVVVTTVLAELAIVRFVLPAFGGAVSLVLTTVVVAGPLAGLMGAASLWRSWPQARAHSETTPSAWVPESGIPHIPLATLLNPRRLFDLARSRPRLALALVGIPMIVWLTAVFWLATRVPALVRAVRGVLEGGGGLRSIVFGTGAALLIGGLGAQFYATF